MNPTKIIIRGVPEPMAALDKIKIIENHEPLVDLRTIPELVFRPEPEKFYPYLRKTVVEMVREASSKLPKEYHLYVVSALRSFTRQKEIWQLHYERQKQLHPNWPEANIKRAANQYAAPVDRPAPPGHTTGAAIDVVLQKADGSFVDLVPPNLTDWSLGHTWTDKVTQEVKESRMMLLETMLSVGFSNCRDEYWHYSYGDSGWAVRVGEKECCYGVIEPPKQS